LSDVAGAEENARIALTISESFNDREFDRGLALFAPGFEMVNMATGAVYRGVEGFRRDMEYWATAFPDCYCDVTSVIATEDKAVVEFIARGTNTGPLVNPGSVLPPTGRTLEIANCEIYEIEGGKIARGRAYYDAETVRRQLGLPAEAPAGAVPG
jgi:steroid delta-isomerase-like uncharacterized protein